MATYFRNAKKTRFYKVNESKAIEVDFTGSQTSITEFGIDQWVGEYYRAIEEEDFVKAFGIAYNRIALTLGAKVQKAAFAVRHSR